MYTVLGILCAGIFIGYLCHKTQIFKGLDKSISWTIYLMLFFFGITIGTNPSVLENIADFGLEAAVISLFAVLGSLVMSMLAYKIFLKRGGRIEK